MILLQNPDLPTATDAIEIDKAIITINNYLKNSIWWLNYAYGRAFKNRDSKTGETLFFPEVYLGIQNKTERYINILPDNDKRGQCFFYVSKETITEYATGQYNFLNYDVSIIFSVNMDLIKRSLLDTEIYQHNLIAQVRNVLIRKMLGNFFTIKINTIDFSFDTVFSEFNIPKPEQLERAPYSHFRINCIISMQESCPAPSVDL